MTASVAYGCATFIDLTLSTFSTSFADGYSLNRVFLIFLIVLRDRRRPEHLQRAPDGDHEQRLGVVARRRRARSSILILVFVPDHHQSMAFVFTERINNSRLLAAEPRTGSWSLPLGFLLTQYTITGFDASAHLSEETDSASHAAAKGIWRSIFYSAIGGWILLLSFLFAVQDPDKVDRGRRSASRRIFDQASSSRWAGLVLLISASGQFYCTIVCMTSTSRMTFAFSRDGAIPGSRLWSQADLERVPANAVMLCVAVSVLITLPALVTRSTSTGLHVPVAFYAVVSIAVIGLYLAFAIPIYLRWRMGDSFSRLVDQRQQVQVDEPHRGRRDRRSSRSTSSCRSPRPRSRATTTSRGSSSTTHRSSRRRAASSSTIWWEVSAKNWFTGPKHTIDPAVVEAFES